MLLFITTIISMLVLGWIVWITVQKQEAGDQRFQDKLDADDERARKGREALREEIMRQRGKKS